MTRSSPPTWTLGLVLSVWAVLSVGAVLGQEEAPAAGGEETRVGDQAVPPIEEPEVAADGDDGEGTDEDVDKPGLLVITTDGECILFVNGDPEGRLAPGEKLEVQVELGEVELRAVSADKPGATWEDTLEMSEPGVEAVRIKMKRAIKGLQRDERKSAVFRDTKTNLMWAMRDNGKDVDMRRAYAYCRDLETGGFDGWRLPTLDELKSLEAIWLRATYKILGGIVLTECCIWSSEYDSAEQRAWTFNYRFREPFKTNAGYSLGLRALCVRDWSPEADDPPEAENGSNY